MYGIPCLGCYHCGQWRNGVEGKDKRRHLLGPFRASRSEILWICSDKTDFIRFHFQFCRYVTTSLRGEFASLKAFVKGRLQWITYLMLCNVFWGCGETPIVWLTHDVLVGMQGNTNHHFQASLLTAGGAESDKYFGVILSCCALFIALRMKISLWKQQPYYTEQSTVCLCAVLTRIVYLGF